MRRRRGRSVSDAAGIGPAAGVQRKEIEDSCRRVLTGFRACEVACHRTYAPLPASRKLRRPFGRPAPLSASAERGSVAGRGLDQRVYIKTSITSLLQNPVDSTEVQTLSVRHGLQMLRQWVCVTRFVWNPETMRVPVGGTGTPVQCLAANRAWTRRFVRKRCGFSSACAASGPRSAPRSRTSGDTAPWRDRARGRGGHRTRP